MVMFEGGMRPPVDVLKLAVKQIAIMTNIVFESKEMYKGLGELLWFLCACGKEKRCTDLLFTHYKFPEAIFFNVGGPQ